MICFSSADQKLNNSGVEDRTAILKEGTSFKYPGIGITHLASDKNVIRKQVKDG